MRDRCICGKVKFSNEWKADQKVKEIGHLKRSYYCSLSNSYHVTKKVQWYPDDTIEMVSLRTVRIQIIDYMRKLYEDTGEYKLTSRMVKDHFKGRESSVAYEISTLKSRGLITNLDETAPSRGAGAPARYFALTEVLEKVTSPAPIIPEQTTKELDMAQPSTQTPASTVNPFTKVQGQLEVIQAQLKGLSQGYSEIHKTLQHIKETSPTPVVHNPLQPQLISVKDLAEGLEYSYRTILDKLETLVLPADATNEYKEAFKDGIKFAVEMGLHVRES